MITQWRVDSYTVWKVSKYEGFSGPYFPGFGLNTEKYGVSFRIQSECRKIRIRKNSVFGHFSRSFKPVQWKYDTIYEAQKIYTIYT